MVKEKTSRVVSNPSSNWKALRKELSQKTTHESDLKGERQVKRRKLDHRPSTETLEHRSEGVLVAGEDAMGGESRSSLRRMISGEIDHNEAQQLPGKYLALDCEMVGVGLDGSESSLARVSVVNFHGAILMDEFVRQRERVVDYRTRYSGVRPADLVKAKPFNVLQKEVADLLKDKILVGHAIHNDLKALLLSHPRLMTRDTQYYAGKYKVVKSKRVALRDLVKQELGITIQSGEHSSVTDARATMAVYRLHRKNWEKAQPSMVMTMKKRKRDKSESTSVIDEAPEFPGGGRIGVSSGLTTITRKVKKKNKWWKQVLGSDQSVAT